MARIDLDDAGRLLLRVVLGGLMLLHGLDKLAHGIGGIHNKVGDVGLPGFIAYGVYVGEVIAPLFMIAGYKTRIAALVFSFNMVVAALLVHSGDIFALGRNGQWKIETLGLYMFGGIAVALLGAGQYSVSKGRGRWD